MIDSISKRAAAVGFGWGVGNTPQADGVLSLEDRALLMGGYPVGGSSGARHYYALQKLMPRIGSCVDLGEQWDRLLWVVGARFDSMEDAAMALLDEMFPGSIEALLAEWESLFAIIPPAGSTASTRNETLQAAWRAVRGSLAVEHMENIAKGLGYTIGSVGTKHLRIVEGSYAGFKVGLGGGRIGITALWDQSAGASTYTWRVIGTAVESDTTLQRMLSKYKTAGTEVVFEND